MSTTLPFANNNIQVFAYEGFDYVISNPDPLSTLQTVSNSAGLNPSSLYFTKDDNNSYRFTVSDLSMNLTAGSTEQFVLSTTTPLVSSNTVVVNPGRFLDENGLSLSNRSFTFFKNEPIPRIRIVAPSFELKQPIANPTLPPGVTFVRVDSNRFDISGIPLVTVPNSNYQIIGVQDRGSKVVTTRINFAISNERVRLNVSNPVISGMQVDTPIIPRILTAIPPVGTALNGVRYTFPSFPDGIIVTDITGAVRQSPFSPTDPSYTLIVSGTPTLSAANAFKNAGAPSTGFTFNVLASRIVPSPLVETVQPFQLSFGETVLFDTTVVPPLFVGVPVSSVFFRAETYFTSNVGISNITALSLPTGLSLDVDLFSGRANLVGTPTSAQSGNFIIRAENSNSVARDLVTPITVLSDTVTFSSPTDLSYSFILSRPVSQAKTGYYPSNIQFAASSSSGRAVTLSAPALSGTGLSLDSNGFIVGTPTRTVPLSDLNVSASVSGSPATAIKTVKFSILDDEFTFLDVPSSNFNFIQNIPSTPFQFPVTTLSGRNVINFSQTGFPSGLLINPAGVLEGTPSSSSPLSGTGRITATTGFALGSRDFPYNLVPDSMLFILDRTQKTYLAGQSIAPINIDAFSYSGTPVTRFDLSINPTYGLTIGSTTGVVSGTWTANIPPSVLLPASCNFSVTGQAGSLLGNLPARFTADPTLANQIVFGASSLDPSTNTTTSSLYSTIPSDVSSWRRINQLFPDLTSGGSDVYGFLGKVKLKNTDISTNLLVFPVRSQVWSGSNLYDEFISVNVFTLEPRVGGGFTEIESALSAMTNVHIPGTSNWFVAGRKKIDGDNNAFVFSSTNDAKLWDTGKRVGFNAGGVFWSLKTRDNGSNALIRNTYLYGGLALGYGPQNILIAGGIRETEPSAITHSMLWSQDQGTTWSNVQSGFPAETAEFSVEGTISNGVRPFWIATGSDLYRTVDFVDVSGASFQSTTVTIRYSFDYGISWTPVRSGGFTMFGYEVMYANNTWIATGVSGGTQGGIKLYVPEVRCSTNGFDWDRIELFTGLFNVSTVPLVAPLRVGSMSFDGNFWYIFVNRPVFDASSNETSSTLHIYRHDATSSLLNGWTSIDVTNSGVSGDPDQLKNLYVNSSTRITSFTPPTFYYSSDPPTRITLDFPGGQEVGPVVTEPVNRSFLQYQYIPIPPIQLASAGSGQDFFFQATDLPPGLRFSPLTNQISGTPAQIGQYQTRFYATKPGIDGNTVLTLSFNVIIPRVIRKQEGAGAYTSLLRQYTDVLGAQNARDNRVLPNQERALGEFMSPEAPDVVTQSNNCCPK